MPLRYDALLARALAHELGRRWEGARATALLLDSERRAAELRFAGPPSLLFLLHPQAGHLLSGGGGAAQGGIGEREVARREGKEGGAAEGRGGEEAAGREAGELAGRAHPFRRLYLGRPSAPPDERLLLLPLVDARGRERHRVVAELHTNQWNLLLLDVPELRIRAALWPRQAGGRTVRAGATYMAPAGARRGAEEPLSREAWHALLAGEPPARRRGVALRHVAWLSGINVDWVLGAAAEPDQPHAAAAREAAAASRPAEAAPLVDAHGRYLTLWEAVHELPHRPSAWRLLDTKTGPVPYPLELDQASAPARPSLLDAMEEAARREEARERWVAPGGVEAGAATAARAEEAGELRDALLARHRSLRSRSAALRRELEEGEDPADLRAVGNLLLARLPEIERGARFVRLRDFDGSEREVELDPRLDGAANAAAYYDRASRRERAAERIPPALESNERRVAEVERALERLSSEGPSDGLWEAAGGRPAVGERRRGEEERLPYVRYRSTGGLELRVGRGARANDDLTFHHSSPDDIWLHAREARGAHVILRWGRSDENPPRRDLLEAAVAAALHSGARHSGTVPVDWTRRKYVRKPRKAPPGAVLPDRVQTLFVEPDPKLLERLKESL